MLKKAVSEEPAADAFDQYAYVKLIVSTYSCSVLKHNAALFQEKKQ